MMLQACLASLLAIRGGKVHRYGIRSATALAYLCDDTVGFLRATAVMHQNLRTGRSEREGAGAPDAARGAGHKSGFAGEIRHERLLRYLMLGGFDC